MPGDGREELLRAYQKAAWVRVVDRGLRFLTMAFYGLGPPAWALLGDPITRKRVLFSLGWVAMVAALTAAGKVAKRRRQRRVLAFLAPAAGLLGARVWTELEPLLAWLDANWGARLNADLLGRGDGTTGWFAAGPGAIANPTGEPWPVPLLVVANESDMAAVVTVLVCRRQGGSGPAGRRVCATGARPSRPLLRVAAPGRVWRCGRVGPGHCHAVGAQRRCRRGAGGHGAGHTQPVRSADGSRCGGFGGLDCPWGFKCKLPRGLTGSDLGGTCAPGARRRGRASAAAADAGAAPEGQAAGPKAP